MKTPAQLRRAAILRQRSRIRPQRVIVAVRLDEERNGIEYRCLTCERTHFHEFPRTGPKALTGDGLIRIFNWHGGDGVAGKKAYGDCPYCTKKARDELYPLPAKFVVKMRESDGMYEARSMMGTRRGMRWGKWRKMSEHDTEEAARAAIEARPNKSALLDEWAVFHRGKRLP